MGGRYIVKPFIGLIKWWQIESNTFLTEKRCCSLYFYHDFGLIRVICLVTHSISNIQYNSVYFWQEKVLNSCFARVILKCNASLIVYPQPDTSFISNWVPVLQFLPEPNNPSCNDTWVHSSFWQCDRSIWDSIKILRGKTCTYHFGVVIYFEVRKVDSHGIKD